MCSMSFHVDQSKHSFKIYDSIAHEYFTHITLLIMYRYVACTWYLVRGTVYDFVLTGNRVFAKILLRATKS